MSENIDGNRLFFSIRLLLTAYCFLIECKREILLVYAEKIELVFKSVTECRNCLPDQLIICKHDICFDILTRSTNYTAEKYDNGADNEQRIENKDWYSKFLIMNDAH